MVVARVYCGRYCRGCTQSIIEGFTQDVTVNGPVQFDLDFFQSTEWSVIGCNTMRVGRFCSLSILPLAPGRGILMIFCRISEGPRIVPEGLTVKVGLDRFRLGTVILWCALSDASESKVFCCLP